MKTKSDTPLRRAPSCDMPASACKPSAQPRSVIRRHKGNYTWNSVRTEHYKDSAEGWAAISRNILSGIYGEKTRFHVRYFEIAPKGYSSLECHRHEHVVICIRGRGRIVLGGKSHILKPFDVAYIAPDDVHQLRNPYGEAFGFLCMVDAKRDLPRPVGIPRRPKTSAANSKDLKTK